jgi:5-methylcytosine-specific restriction endonuclease McrA
MRAKCREEGRCRVCLKPGGHEAAHLIARSQAKPGVGEDPRNAIPLCSTCHRAFDTRRLDVLMHLEPDELAFAVELAGSVPAAVRRLAPGLRS